MRLDPRQPIRRRLGRRFDEAGARGSCNGICLTAADIGLGEYGGIAYPHPECELHGDGVFLRTEYRWRSVWYRRWLWDLVWGRKKDEL